jgi:hypothetical protein
MITGSSWPRPASLKAIKELRIQLHDMRRAAHPFLTDEARRVYWAKAWELFVVHAAARVEGNRKEFYALRLTAIISAITVPSLVGLNLSGTGGTTVRWLTFAFSLIAAADLSTRQIRRKPVLSGLINEYERAA